MGGVGVLKFHFGVRCYCVIMFNTFKGTMIFKCGFFIYNQELQWRTVTIII